AENELPPATVNMPYYYMVPVTDTAITPPYTYELMSGPYWLTLDQNTGVLGGMPAAADVVMDFPVMIRVTGSTGMDKNYDYMLDVFSEGGPAENELPPATVNMPYYYMVPVTDTAITPPYTYELMSGPYWLTLDQNTGVLGGMPAAADVVMDFPVMIRVTGSTGMDKDYNYMLDVFSEGGMVENELPPATVNMPYYYMVSVIDPAMTPPYTYELMSGPYWLTLDQNTGVLGGMPTAADVVMDFPVMIRVTGSTGMDKNYDYMLDVFSEGGMPGDMFLPMAIVNMPYYYMLTKKNPDDSFQLISGPQWLKFDSAAGEFGGMPAAADVGYGIPVVIRVNEVAGTSHEETYTIDVQGEGGADDKNNQPSIITTSLPDAKINLSYAVVIETFDPDSLDTVIFQLVSGPEWLSIDASTGLLSGTPGDGDTGKDIAVVISVTDKGGLSDEITLNLNVAEEVISTKNQSPTIITTSLPDAKVNLSYAVVIEASDPDSLDTVTFQLISGPEWLSIDASTGLLLGTPGDDDVGADITVSVSVSDAGGLTDTFSATINVLYVNNPPVFLTAELQNATEGIEYSYTLVVDDPNKDDTLTFTLLENPEWLTVDTQGILSGTPDNDDVGADITVSVSVSDAGGLTDTFSTTINVLNVNNPPVFLTTELWDATEGIVYSDTLFADDPDEGDTFTFALLESPGWLTIDTQGILSGTPGSDDTGKGIPVSILVSGAGGLADTLLTKINVVLDIVIEEIVISPEDAAVNIGENIMYSAIAYDTIGNIVESAAIHWSVVGEVGEIDEDGKFTAIEGGKGFIVASVTVRDDLVSNITDVTVSLKEATLPEIIVNEQIPIEEFTYPLDFMNGAKLFFPLNSISEEISIAVKLPSFARVDNDKKEVEYEGDIISAVTFEVIVDSEVVSPYVFNEPVEISIPYNSTLLSNLGIDPMDIRLFYVTLSGKLEAEGISDIIVDTSYNIISAKVTHFSNFAIAPKYAGPTLLGDFDYNMNVDFYDFAQLVAYWNAGNNKGDIVGKPDGENIAGIPPWYSEGYPYPPDGVIDFEDMVAFSMMYNWYQYQNSDVTVKPVIAAKGAPSLFTAGLNWNEQDYKVGDTFLVSFTPGDINGFLGAEIVLNFTDNILKVNKVTSGFDSVNNYYNTPVQFKTSEGNLIANTVVLGNLSEGISISGENIINVEFEVIGSGHFSVGMSSVDMRSFRNIMVPLNGENRTISGKIGTLQDIVPLTFDLSQNFPNPFNMSTTINYILVKEGEVNISIYTSQGQRIKTLFNNTQSAGQHSIIWNGTDDENREVTSGVYIVGLRQGRLLDNKKMLLLR
ncbi:MAG: T9SS type A sorting domain-containing protein, partial [Candidatus Latescibacteria bacterium]|nr:T9SS type A sorting domain-containing protein [Candidatus Latescibacterota bacterium]